MALSLDIGANTRQAASQIKNLGDDLETVVDALDDVGKGGKDAGDKLERALRDAEAQAKDTDKAVERVGSDGFSKAGSASGEFKQEALSNFSEVTSSFDGSMSSIQDLAQGTLGGIASTGLPGIGLAAGIAAAGVGLIGSAFAANDEAAQASIEKVNEWADKYIEAKGRALTEEQILGEVQRIATEDTEAYADALTIQGATGEKIGVVLRAMAGDTEALSAVNGALRDATEQSNGALAEQEQQVTSAAGKVYDHADAIDKARGLLEQQASAMDGGAAKAKAYADAAALGAQKTNELSGAINNTPGVKDVTVRVNVDDTAWRNYRPTNKFGEIVAGPGQGRTWQ